MGETFSHFVPALLGSIYARGKWSAGLLGMWLLLVLGGCGDAPSGRPEQRMAPVSPPGQVTLRWEAPHHNADGSELQDLAGYRINIYDETMHSQRSVVIGDVTEYTVTGLHPGHRYLFQVGAYDQMHNISEWSNNVVQDIPYSSKINFIYSPTRTTPTPEGWVEYDGSPYDPERGFGWLTDLRKNGRDRGSQASIELPDGTQTTPQKLNRLELANWQGRHQENHPLVFRVDVPNGWYRVTCSSVDPGISLPLVDQRSFKCRAHDVVLAGPDYGAPLKVKGKALVEGSGIVEVTDGQLRVVVGDPAYAGWTWEHPGPWYAGWLRWIGFEHGYATSWWQKVQRKVDPGFHMLRLNSLEVEQIAPPPGDGTLIFRDVFNRDNSHDITKGLDKDNYWEKVKLSSDWPANLDLDLFQTSMRIVSPQDGVGGVGLLQQQISPGQGMVRYSTRVSLFTGEGSRKHSGRHEAGILLLADTQEPPEYSSTFIGVGFDGSQEKPQGTFIYRVGDGKKAYRTNLELPDGTLPFSVREGEYEIVVQHDVKHNAIATVQINGIDLIDRIPESDRNQRISQGSFGLRSVMDRQGSGVELKQFYWSMRVDRLD